MVKERPILFSGQMVRAILEDRKTQTRRIIKPQPDPHLENGWLENDQRIGFVWKDEFRNGVQWIKEFSPFGQPGDRLWVRETYFLYGHWKKNGQTKKGKQKWRFITNPHQKPVYQDALPLRFRCEKSKTSVGYFKRPSIFMRRQDSRLILKISNIAVQRLNDLSEDEAYKEGCSLCYPIRGECLEDSFKRRFERLWKSINGAGSWEKNPWVWVMEFKRVKPHQQENKK